ncbi:MAG TPA: amino acid permease [Candidatus Acidoferrales bacterium]|nr:amino acid permease [Candidatus Acidoferrales bacterium]
MGTAALIVVANMIGSGIFTTSGFVARDVGSPGWLMGLWLAGGLIALAGALSYAELGAAFPQAGGEYVYLREAYGPFVAYLTGWTSLAVGFSGAIAAATLAFAGYLHSYFPAMDRAGSADKVVALAALWSLTAIHVRGLGPGGVVQRLLTGGTMLAIAALVCAAFTLGHGSASNFNSSAPAHGSVAVSLIFILYAYSGWNAAAYLAGEIRNPRREIPTALVAGTALVTLLYLAMNAMYLYALPIPAMSGVLTIAEKASVALFGPFAAHLVAAMLALALLGSVNAMVLAGPRVYFAMARDGLLPRALGVVDLSRGTPARAVLLQSGWASVLIVFFGAFERLVVYTGFAITVFTAMAVAALIVLRVRRPGAPRPFTVPGYPWTPAAYVIVSIWIVAVTMLTRPTETVLGALTVVAGVPFYFCARRRNRRMAIHSSN